MTMHINLSAEMEAYIKAKVASGLYGNATEVIRDAIRRMQFEETRVAASTVSRSPETPSPRTADQAHTRIGRRASGRTQP